MSDAQQEKWLKVMKTELMSSEDSDGDSIVVHPLPWRSKYVTNMFEKIDGYCCRRKSIQAKRQMKARITGGSSVRPTPHTPDTPDWAINNTA